MKNETITIDANKTGSQAQLRRAGPRNGLPPSLPGAPGTSRANGTTWSGLTS